VSLEDDVRSALVREPAPPGFGDRVLARAQGKHSRSALVWAIAAGVTIGALIPGAALEYRHREKERALEARRELIVAITITRAKFRETREKIQRATNRGEHGKHVL
jgi:hypothetical protein